MVIAEVTTAGNQYFVYMDSELTACKRICALDYPESNVKILEFDTGRVLNEKQPYGNWKHDD